MLWWLFCKVFRLHNWWTSGDGERVCLNCGKAEINPAFQRYERERLTKLS